MRQRANANINPSAQWQKWLEKSVGLCWQFYIIYIITTRLAVVSLALAKQGFSLLYYNANYVTLLGEKNKNTYPELVEGWISIGAKCFKFFVQNLELFVSIGKAMAFLFLSKRWIGSKTNIEDFEVR